MSNPNRTCSVLFGNVCLGKTERTLRAFRARMFGCSVFGDRSRKKRGKERRDEHPKDGSYPNAG